MKKQQYYDLEEPVAFRMETKTTEAQCSDGRMEKYNYECSYYDDIESEFSSKDCRTIRRDGNTVHCECDRAVGEFAIVTDGKDPCVSDEDKFPIEIILYIVIGLVVLCGGFFLFKFISNKKDKNNDRLKSKYNLTPFNSSKKGKRKATGDEIELGEIQLDDVVTDEGLDLENAFIDDGSADLPPVNLDDGLSDFGEIQTLDMPDDGEF